MKKPPFEEYFDWDKEPTDRAVKITDPTEVREFDADDLVVGHTDLVQQLGKHNAALLIALTIERDSAGTIKYKHITSDEEGNA